MATFRKNLLNVDIKSLNSKELDQAIKIIAKDTKQKLPTMLKRQASFFLTSINKMTKRSKKKKKWRRINSKKNPTLYHAGGWRYEIQNYTRGGRKLKPLYAKTIEEREKKREINTRGLMRAGWSELQRKNVIGGKGAKATARNRAIARKYAKYKDKSKRTIRPSVNLNSDFNYTTKILNSGQVNQALMLAKRRLVGWWKNKMVKKQKREWSKVK